MGVAYKRPTSKDNRNLWALFGSFIPKLSLHSITELRKRHIKLTKRSKPLSYAELISHDEQPSITDKMREIIRQGNGASLNGCWSVCYNGKISRIFNWLSGLCGFKSIPYTFKRVIYENNACKIQEFDIEWEDGDSDNPVLYLIPKGEKGEGHTIAAKEFYARYPEEKALSTAIHRITNSIRPIINSLAPQHNRTSQAQGAKASSTQEARS